MGTSGNRKGFKVFSINTTVRNPKRNYDFLKAFEDFDGIENTQENLYKYYFNIIKNGVYKSINAPLNVIEKWENNLELTSDEVCEIIENNPQATGESGRVMTQLRALKEQNLLRFYQASNNKVIIKITDLGKELLKNPAEAPTIYTKVMLSMHAHNPCRVHMLNKSVPFLNTLFVIDEVNKQWEAMGNEPKGILMHEFGTFVLTMKDCDYKKAASEIINYRKEFKFKINVNYIKNYLKYNDILECELSTVIKDYPDDVFRKFEMTSLIIKHGSYEYQYINFSAYNKEKVNSILSYYKDYEFKEFTSIDDYFNYQSSISIPWEQNDKVRRKIVEAKADVLNIKLMEEMPLKDKEIYLDSLFYNTALQKACDKYDFELIKSELLILSGSLKQKSKFDSLSEPLRLEYLLALMLGKRYGTKGLVSNIIYNEDGLPLHCAVGGKCDISYHDEKGSYILEPTMQRSRNQQLNTETNNIVRHALNEERKYGIQHRVMMIAPRVHADVIDYFRFKVSVDKAKIISFTIEKTLGLIVESENIDMLNTNYDKELGIMISVDKDEYADLVNAYKYQ